MQRSKAGPQLPGTATGPGTWCLKEVSKAGRGEARTHLAAFLMAPSPVPCDRETQPPQGPRVPLGAHITAYATIKLQPRTLSPLQNHIPPQLGGRYQHRGKLGNKPPSLQSQKAGYSLSTSLWGSHHSLHSTTGLHGGMQRPRFMAERCQPCRDHHSSQELPCCGNFGVQTG